MLRTNRALEDVFILETRSSSPRKSGSCRAMAGQTAKESSIEDTRRATRNRTPEFNVVARDISIERKRERENNGTLAFASLSGVAVSPLKEKFLLLFPVSYVGLRA